MYYYLALSATVVATLLCAAPANAEDYVLTLKGNQFSPKELTIPANQKVKITVKNSDSTPAEFESSDLSREKLVGANSEISMFVGPLDAGKYGFFDDFHRDATTGTLIVK